ncbi:MAG: integrase core domain-containing protein [Candidatus Sumerlaeota bacterium]
MGPGAYANGTELRRGLERYMRRYNERRPHSSLGDATPSEVYGGSVQLEAA